MPQKHERFSAIRRNTSVSARFAVPFFGLLTFDSRNTRSWHPVKSPLTFVFATRGSKSEIIWRGVAEGTNGSNARGDGRALAALRTHLKRLLGQALCVDAN